MCFVTVHYHMITVKAHLKHGTVTIGHKYKYDHSLEIWWNLNMTHVTKKGGEASELAKTGRNLEFLLHLRMSLSKSRVSHHFLHSPDQQVAGRGCLVPTKIDNIWQLLLKDIPWRIRTYGIYTFTYMDPINIPQMLAYIPYMEHMGVRCDVVPSWPILTRSEVCPENEEVAESTGDG